MKRFLLPVSVALLCVALLLSPIIAALPDDTTAQQPLWASILSACVFLSAVLCCLAERVGDDKKIPVLAFAGLITWAAVSVLARLVMQRSMAFFGPMLHGLATWGAFGTAFALCAHLARQGRTYFYTLVGTILAASAWAAATGLNEYLQHVSLYLHFGNRSELLWRVFGTSTPDFLAAYFVLTVPVTLAVLLRLPSGKEMNSPLLGIALPGLTGLVLLTQAMTLLATGSRFALVSVVMGVATFSLALWKSVQSGFSLEKTARVRLIILSVLVLVPALVVARPVLARLSNLHDNSGAFRLWTWRGAAHMAAANPVVGTGVGTWQDIYPRYALVGFTRLAHNSYLQMADECGLPGVLLLLAVLGLTVRAGVKGLATAPAVAETPPYFSAVGESKQAGDMHALQTRKERKRNKGNSLGFSPPQTMHVEELLNDTLLQCGLLGAVVGGIVQNLIDSDWYVFFFSLTFWALAGLLLGLTEYRRESAYPPPSTTSVKERRWLLTGGATILCAYFFAQAAAAFYSAQGRTAQNVQDAQTFFALAQVWDKLNARHYTDMASQVYNPAANFPAAEGQIRQAIRLQPSSGNFLRLGRVLAVQHKTAEALAAYQAGLLADPNSVDLLLEAARLSPDDRRYYQRMADLEIGPVGTVRAIGEIVEVKFAYADAALGLNARAARLLEAYAAEGGSTNIERKALTGGLPNPAQDRDLRALYVIIMNGLSQETPPAERLQIAQRRQKTLVLFDKVLAPLPDGVH